MKKYQNHKCLNIQKGCRIKLVLFSCEDAIAANLLPSEDKERRKFFIRRTLILFFMLGMFLGCKQFILPCYACLPSKGKKIKNYIKKHYLFNPKQQQEDAEKSRRFTKAAKIIVLLSLGVSITLIGVYLYPYWSPRLRFKRPVKPIPTVFETIPAVAQKLSNLSETEIWNLMDQYRIYNRKHGYEEILPITDFLVEYWNLKGNELSRLNFLWKYKEALKAYKQMKKRNIL